MAETEYARSEGGSEVAYREIGGDGHAVLYISGALVPIECMDDDPVHARWLRGLAELGRLFVFDRRGSARPTRPTGSSRSSRSGSPTRSRCSTRRSSTPPR